MIVAQSLAWVAFFRPSLSVFVGGWAVQQLWLFWIAPLLGAAAAGFIYKGLLEGPVEAPPVTGRPAVT